MKRWIFFTFLVCSSQVRALIPIEGLILGDTRDIPQYDPLGDVFNKKKEMEGKELRSFELAKLKKYIGLYNQSENLKLSCKKNSTYNYSNYWQESNARRSIVATLQYLGIDMSMRAIVAYAKLLDFSEEEFSNVANNLLTNTCSKNISVYSLKLLKENFSRLYQDEKGFRLPSIKGSPYFSDNIKDLTNSLQSKKHEMELTLKIFRSLCSWNGDTDNYRLIAPYLANPAIMSIVFNHLQRQKLEWNSLQKEVTIVSDPNSVQVACQDFICRKRSPIGFNEMFPRMLGATKLSGDLKALYCGHFKDQSYVVEGQNPQILKWINSQKVEDPLLEGQQFLALYTGITDPLIASNQYSDIEKSLRKSIDQHWTKWAKKKSSQLVSDLMYEESLQVELKPASSLASEKGEFQIRFDLSLGELDRVLDFTDKLDSVMYLNFPKSYFRWVKKEFISANNKSDRKAFEKLHKNFEAYVQNQMLLKEDSFLVPVWNKNISAIIADELTRQIMAYRGSRFNGFDHENLKIPVRFNYGLFALQYLRERFVQKYRSSLLTIGIKSPK